MSNHPFLRRLYTFFLLGLPVACFFSYHPVISLGANSSMNFELSLALIWLVLFDVIGFTCLLRGWRTLFTNLGSLSDRRFFLFALLPLYATLSILWSENPLRALLTAGIIWLIFFAVFFIVYLTPLLLANPHSRPRLRQTFLKVFFTATTAVCIFCFIQSIWDILGGSRADTLLCAGCTYQSFGFPHPSGFAIEPQFMGNLLLAPTLLTLYLLCSDKQAKTEKDVIKSEHFHSVAITPNKKTEQTTSIIATTVTKPEQTSPITTTPVTKTEQTTSTFPQSAKNLHIIHILALLFCTTLFFIFSRGAIYAFLVALLILIIFTIIRKTFKIQLIIIPLISFAAALCLQGTFATLGPTTETFPSAVAKSIHHLSLGLIDLRVTKTNAPAQSAPTRPTLNPEPAPRMDTPLSSDAINAARNTATNSSNLEEPQDAPAAPSDAPIFDGYVAESTNVRLNFSASALRAWVSSPKTFLIGTGLGGAGTALYRLGLTSSAKEIIQNEPLSLLLELGLIGAILIIFSLLLAFVPQLFPRRFLDGRTSDNSVENSAKFARNLAKPVQNLAQPVEKSPQPAQNSKNSVQKPTKNVQNSAKTVETKVENSPVTVQNIPRTMQNPHKIEGNHHTTVENSTPNQQNQNQNQSPDFLHHPALPLLVSLIAAYVISMQFFSGLPNALHIYLLPAIIFSLYL